MTTPDRGDSAMQQCAAAIRKAGCVLAICHVDPDGDAIGSLLGLGWLLRAMGSRFVVACDSPEPENMAFLPHPGPVAATCPDGCDLIVTVDCSSHDRLGRFCSEQQLASLPIVNIDHHVTNTSFGAVNWVDTEAAATAEMIYRLVAFMDVPLSREMAVCLLAGLVSDTWGFRTPNTTVRSMEAALQTMYAGASLPDVVAHTVDARSFSSVCLWGRALSEAHLQSGVLWVEITQEHLRACHTEHEGKRGLANFLMSVRECRVTVVLTETDDNKTDVSLRSQPGIDVSGVALSLGGGGHPQAAGCTLPESLPEAREKVKSVLYRSLEQQSLYSPGGVEA